MGFFGDLLKVGLPIAGGALFGPLGFAGGSAISGALQSSQDRGSAEDQMNYRNAILTRALEQAERSYAPLAPLISNYAANPRGIFNTSAVAGSLDPATYGVLSQAQPTGRSSPRARPEDDLTGTYRGGGSQDAASKERQF